MARLQNCMFGGLIVLTLTVILNTDPAAAANCNSAADCMNSGTCDDPGNAPCTCVNDWMGDDCADACAATADCEVSASDGASCNTGNTPSLCVCADTTKAGPGCALTKCVAADCKNSGTCPSNELPPCDCSASDFVGNTCEDEVCTADTDCNNERTCDLTATPKVCSCGDYLGKTCDDECALTTDCEVTSGDGGDCDTSGATAVCTCADITKGGPGCTATKCTSSSCKNGGSCPSSGVLPCTCSGNYKGDTCEDECTTNEDCEEEADDGGVCDTSETNNVCNCNNDKKSGPGCSKSGASKMTAFSLMSFFVVLIGCLL